MLTIVEIDKNNCSYLEDLDVFIKKNPEGCKSFRYFNKRPYNIIQNHIYTCLYYLDNECVGYGHLDEEDDKVWLGILVSDSKKGQKIGDKIMDDLISKTNSDISLSVDINNLPAFKLYEKKGFVTISRNIHYKTMKLTK